MNHGQFYKADQLVAGVHNAQGGIFEGFRAAHASGRIYTGTFTATPAAKALSRAAHFQGPPVPVTARLSGTSGNPEQKASKVVAMATKFYLPNGTERTGGWQQRGRFAAESPTVPAMVAKE